MQQQFPQNSIIYGSSAPRIVSSRVVKTSLSPNDVNQLETTPQPRNQEENNNSFDNIQELSEDKKSDRRIVNALVLILPLILAILFLIVSFKLIYTNLNNVSSLEGADNVLEFVHHNLNANPIISWTTTINGECPDDHDETELGEWKGIRRGCLCSNGDSFIEDSYTRCLSIKDNGCYYQSSYDDKDYHNWVMEDVRFCEKRVGKDRWQRVAECDTDRDTRCGQSVCLDEQNSVCPPNTATVSNLSDPSANLKGLLSGMTNKDISSESMVVIRPERKGLPPIVLNSEYNAQLADKSATAFVDLTISQGKTLCLNDDFSATQNQIYTLDEQQTNNRKCDQYGELNADQVIVLDSTLETNIYSNNGLQGIYTAANLVNYDDQLYAENHVYLLAVSKIPLAEKEQCRSAFDDDLKDSGHLAKSTRAGLRFFAWIIVILSIVTIILGIVFVTFAVLKKTAQQKQIGQIYWFAAWGLVILAVLAFLFYHAVFSHWLGDHEETLQSIKDADCFPGNSKINLAISKLINFDQQTADKFSPSVSLLLIYSLVYSFIWMIIAVVWHYKYDRTDDLLATKH